MIVVDSNVIAYLFLPGEYMEELNALVESKTFKILPVARRRQLSVNVTHESSDN